VFLHINLSQTVRLGFNLDAHETLRALTLYMLDLFLKILRGLFRALLSLPVICYLIEILLVVRDGSGREWE